MNEPIDAVPEADYLEQHTPAYPEADVDPDKSESQDRVLESDSEITDVPAGDSGWTADEGDLVEQSISVPMDEEYQDGDSEY